MMHSRIAIAPWLTHNIRSAPDAAGAVRLHSSAHLRRGTDAECSAAALSPMKSRLAITIGIAVACVVLGCSTPSHSSNGERATHSAKPINVVTQHHLSLTLQKEVLAVCKLAPDASVPDWAWSPGTFHTISRTPEELSIVCLDSAVPSEVKKESGWRILKVDGPLDFSLSGILASIAGPLANAGISIFAISTYDTDYVMVKSDKAEEALKVLTKAGHVVKHE